MYDEEIIETLTREIKEVEQRRKEAEDQNQILADYFDNMDDEILDMQQNNDMLEEKIEELKKQNIELEHKLKEAADEIDIMENEINVMVKNNDMMEEIIEKLKKKKEFTYH